MKANKNEEGKRKHIKEKTETIKKMKDIGKKNINLKEEE
jgi:hypothetical protein